MIDTDKYEGHTEGPWDVYGPHPLFRSGAFDDEGVGEHLPFTRVDMKLIADAPLLLAEVKRLQSQYEELKETLIGDSPNWTHDEVVQQALELATLNHNDGDRE